MIQNSHCIYPPELSPRCQESPGAFNPSERVAPQFVSSAIPCVSIQLPLFGKLPEPEVKPGGIDRVLERLSGMDFPGKGSVEEYLRHLYRRNCKPNTLRSALTACQLFLSFIEYFGKTQLEHISRQDLEAFVEHEQDRGLKIVSVRTRLAAVYAFLRFLHDKGAVSAELLVRKIRLRLPEPLPKAIDADDVNKLLSVVDDIRNRAMILVLLRTGMRIGELLDTRVSDVNIAERKITIYEAAKNRVGRVVCVSDDAIFSLKAWMRHRDSNKPILFYGQGRSSLTYQGCSINVCKVSPQGRIGSQGLYTALSASHLRH